MERERELFTAHVERVRQSAEGFHFHEGQCCSEPGCPGTMAGRVDWFNPTTGEYREGV